MTEAIDPQTVLAYAEEALPTAKQGFLREAATTTINQLRRAIEAGEDERARELAAWLKTEDWEGADLCPHCGEDCSSAKECRRSFYGKAEQNA